MHQSVVDIWHTFNGPIEGRLLHMYLDVKGLVTCGVGNLIEPVGEALKLPWLKRDGSPASQQEISEAWHKLKARQDLAHRNARYAAELTGLVLTDSAVDDLVAQKLRANEQYLLAHHFPDFQRFSADAQLGILSMAWAAGPGFPAKFPSFSRAVAARDWATASKECTLREEGNPGVVPRNRADRICFVNAEIVGKAGLPVEELFWPGVASTVTAPTDHKPVLHDLSGIALDEARIYDLDVARLSALREMSGSDDEPTNPINNV